MAQCACPENPFVRLKKMGLYRCQLGGELAQWRYFQDPHTPTMRGGNDFACRWVDCNFMYSHGGQLAFQMCPVGTTCRADPHAKLRATVQQIFIQYILAQNACRSCGQTAVK